MKSLATLIKLQKTFVDEQRILLANAEERLSLINRTIKTLIDQKLREKETVIKDSKFAITYGQFLKKAILRERHLERERKIAEAGVEAARVKLSEVFEEQKRYEIAEEKRIQDEQRAEQKAETLELDEIGGITHGRNQKDT